PERVGPGRGPARPPPRRSREVGSGQPSCPITSWGSEPILRLWGRERIGRIPRGRAGCSRSASARQGIELRRYFIEGGQARRVLDRRAERAPDREHEAAAGEDRDRLTLRNGVEQEAGEQRPERRYEQ